MVCPSRLVFALTGKSGWEPDREHTSAGLIRINCLKANGPSTLMANSRLQRPSVRHLSILVSQALLGTYTCVPNGPCESRRTTNAKTDRNT